MSVEIVMYEALKKIADIDGRKKGGLQTAVNTAKSAMTLVLAMLINEGETRHHMVEPGMSEELEPAEAEAGRPGGPRVGGLFSEHLQDHQ